MNERERIYRERVYKLAQNQKFYKLGLFFVFVGLVIAYVVSHFEFASISLDLLKHVFLGHSRMERQEAVLILLMKSLLWLPSGLSIFLGISFIVKPPPKPSKEAIDRVIQRAIESIKK